MITPVVVIASCVVAAIAAPSPIEDGRWHPTQYGAESGRYLRPRDEGKYIHIPNPYIHDDNPYIHDEDPYKWEESRDVYRLVLSPPPEDNPFYKPGYYENNGIKIIKQQHNYKQDKYDFDFETENKIRAGEEAILKNPNTIDEGIASAGFYEYIGPDGFMYRVDYTADENGFRPKVRRLETPYSGKWVYEKVN